MPFSAVIRPAVIRPLTVARITPISRVCYHNTPKSSYTNGAPSIYVAASFPDDFESSPLAPERPKAANEAHKWDESVATLSEVAVKADRGDVQVNIQQKTKPPKTPTMEDREPELDEM
ncbi:hypothetical protein N7530_002245 [Penicillium desertorum]|uniref:Uncharacterized protein n=1 Tax=Penicillium desertorum TaxID=1303715 RepID=A0A9W9XCR6_9EURO|nr:hypothetical protein N7530_002245 [Penicillium desertorum]